MTILMLKVTLVYLSSLILSCDILYIQQCYFVRTQGAFLLNCAREFILALSLLVVMINSLKNKITFNVGH